MNPETAVASSVRRIEVLSFSTNFCQNLQFYKLPTHSFLPKDSDCLCKLHSFEADKSSIFKQIDDFKKSADFAKCLYGNLLLINGGSLFFKFLLDRFSTAAFYEQVFEQLKDYDSDLAVFVLFPTTSKRESQLNQTLLEFYNENYKTNPNVVLIDVRRSPLPNKEVLSNLKELL